MLHVVVVVLHKFRDDVWLGEEAGQVNLSHGLSYFGGFSARMHSGSELGRPLLSL